MYKKNDDGMRKCPVCKKQFLHNPMSIYKLQYGNRFKFYCSYTCWRSAGGDNKKRYRTSK